MTDDLAFAPLPALAAKLRSGEVSSVELAKFFLARLEKFGPKYNCVVNLTRDLALKQAEAADKELKAGKDRGPLHGIPYGAKDLLATKGIPTTWGCAPYKDRVLDFDATVIAEAARRRGRPVRQARDGRDRRAAWGIASRTPA